MNFKEITQPIVDFSHFNPETRSEGISGFMRLRNEGEFLAQCIESWLPELDELIIVYNNCQDNTGEIAQIYAQKYPNKIKVFHYIPTVYPQGSNKMQNLKENDFHSLVNYYNFALANTTKKWAVKIDGDLIFYKSKGHLRKRYEQIKQENINYALPISGINIIDSKGKIFVGSSSKYAGTNGDLCLFRVDESTLFVKGNAVEVLNLSERKLLPNEFMYYHLKFIKNDFGIGNYDFKNNPNSHYFPKQIIFLATTKLIPLKQVAPKVGLPLVKLSDFGLNRNIHYKKEAFSYLMKQGGKIDIHILIKEIKLYIKINHQKTFWFKFLRKIKRFF